MKNLGVIPCSIVEDDLEKPRGHFRLDPASRSFLFFEVALTEPLGVLKNQRLPRSNLEEVEKFFEVNSTTQFCLNIAPIIE